MYKYASAEFFRKEHTLRKATAPREAGDEVNGPSPTAGWGAVDSGHSHVWVTDVRGGGGGGRWGAVEHGTAWRRWGWCFRRGSPAGPLRALPAPASSLPPTPPATVGPPHTEPLRIQRDALRPPSDLVRPRWPHVRPCPRRPWPPCPGSRWLCPQLRAGGSLCVPHRFVPFALVQPPAGPWGDTTDPNAPSPSASPGD